MIDVALVGCGHMGAHHARVVSAHPGCRLVATVDLAAERAERLAARHGARAVSVVPAEVDAVIVATPTTSHVEVAAPLLARGQWCLVEKPVAEGHDAAAALESDRLVVGHSERFNPAIRGITVHGACDIEARRFTPPSARGRDVDVVLDLMIHDLDLLLWWSGGADVERLDVQASDGDTARVTLTVGSLTASLHASRVASRGERRVRIRPRSEPDLVLDLLQGRAEQGGVSILGSDSRDALTAQWEAFTDAVRGGARAVSLGDGLAALRLALRIRNHIERSAA